MSQLHIGIDFDNTIVCYDTVFYQAAREQGLIPEMTNPSKTSVRDYFRSIQQEDQWTRLQGHVYGARMDLARHFPGFDLFYQTCRANGIQVSIISHKTLYPYLGARYNLHESARKWIEQQSFYNPDLGLYFELTLQEKLKRIELCNCHYFIDDLPELMSEPAFPSKAGKILFDPANIYPSSSKWLKITSWDQMQQMLPQLARS